MSGSEVGQWVVSGYICCLCFHWLSNLTFLLRQCFSGPLIVGLFSLSAINTSTVAISAQVKQTHTRAQMSWCVVDKNWLLLLLQSNNGVLCGLQDLVFVVTK